tara:strand:+ start:744 stop:1043 length:300 start_codon:yes stop_codon:yes gene_type:complete
MQAWPGDIEWNDSTAEKRSRRGEKQVALCILKSKRYYARFASSENATWLVYFQNLRGPFHHADVRGAEIPCHVVCVRMTRAQKRRREQGERWKFVLSDF